MPHARRVFGDAGERVAELVLRERGWRILARNARTRFGEIDLVCHDGRGYVFVEVKTRREGALVPAVEAVTGRKHHRLRGLAEAWLAQRGCGAAPWRIVLVALTVGRQSTDVRLVDLAW